MENETLLNLKLSQQINKVNTEFGKRVINYAIIARVNQNIFNIESFLNDVAKWNHNRCLFVNYIPNFDINKI